ncbi:MAG: sigma 54-interacting transcriptional regulator, partial [Blastocatellia bacterium]
LQILSSIHRDTSRYEGALNALRQSLRISTAIGDMNLVTSAQIALAECHFLQGGYEQAKEYLELTEGRLREERAKSLHVSGWLQRLSGLLEGALGRLAAARQHVAQSISIFTTTEVPYELAKSHLAMAQILATSGEENAAVKHVELALDTFERLGADPEIKLSKEVIPALRSATATAITLPCFRVPLDYRTPVLVQPEELLSESDVTGRTPPVKSAPETASASSASNDVLLMERLIEASHSRELLLQELAAVIHENFPTEFVVVGKIEDEGKPQPVVCQGISAADAEALSEELGTNLREPSKHRGPGFIALLSVAREGLQRNAFAVFVHSMPRSGATLDAGRLNPLIKQAELGLEACQLRAAATSVPEVRDEHRIHTVMPGFIVASPLMLDVIHKIQKIRTSDVTVLITGESGTGKELVARAVHAESARARAIFLPFNCTATPRDLIESQLFGHRRGAFTGATTNYVGMIRAAEGGTLFLDEIGDLALEIQPKLMRFLQEGEIQPLGETRPVRVDVRV